MDPRKLRDGAAAGGSTGATTFGVTPGPVRPGRVTAAGGAASEAGAGATIGSADPAAGAAAVRSASLVRAA